MNMIAVFGGGSPVFHAQIILEIDINLQPFATAITTNVYWQCSGMGSGTGK
jgi:hypothetical protein